MSYISRQKSQASSFRHCDTKMTKDFSSLQISDVVSHSCSSDIEEIIINPPKIERRKTQVYREPEALCAKQISTIPSRIKTFCEPSSQVVRIAMKHVEAGLSDSNELFKG
jgi:hypothetical protein